MPEIIEQYNLVNQKNFVTPNYDISHRETYITLYFNNAGDVIIVGNVDNNYIYWLSVTKTEDTELNEKIFNHVANDGITMVSQMYKALEVGNLRYSDLKAYYTVRLSRAHTHGMAWKTPFGHYYGENQTERNGGFFARDVKHFVKDVHQRCELRECGGRYEAVLEGYLEYLKSEEGYSSKARTLHDLLATEDYLCISPCEKVRQLYMECCKICSELYNQYMTAAR